MAAGAPGRGGGSGGLSSCLWVWCRSFSPPSSTRGGGGHCQGTWEGAAFAQHPAGPPGPRVLNTALYSGTCSAPSQRTRVKSHPTWTRGGSSRPRAGNPTRMAWALPLGRARGDAPTWETCRQAWGLSLGDPAAPAADPREPPSLSPPEGRCPGPRGGGGRRGPAPGTEPERLDQWERVVLGPRLQGGARPRKRAARPGGPAGWEDGGGSPGRRRGEGPGRPACADRGRGRAMIAPPSRPGAAEPARAPSHGAARGLLRAGGVRAAPAR